ncbi:MAG: hypothetical protein HYV92_00545, partial [Candidatus Rokubacteria bacterium]|nr:hypothetical protein [Candidatus Rokubacteria bacterium]
MKKVLVTDGLQEVGIEALRQEGLSVEAISTLPEADLFAKIADAHGLIVRSATKVTARVIEAARSLEERDRGARRARTPGRGPRPDRSLEVRARDPRDAHAQGNRATSPP